MEIRFFTDQTKEFLLSQGPLAETMLARATNRLEIYGHELRMPHSRYLGKGLFELRVIGTSSIRIFYIFKNNMAFILHAFVKKSQEIPSKELAIARERQRVLASV